MRRRIENIYFVVAFAAGIFLAFLPVLPKMTEILFFISLGAGFMTLALALGLTISFKPLRYTLTVLKIIASVACIFLATLVVSPSVNLPFAAPIWILISGFLVMSKDLKFRNLPNYFIVAFAFTLACFPNFRFLAFAVLSLNAFIYVFVIEDRSDRFAAFFVASFSGIAAVYFWPDIPGSVFGLFLSIASLGYGFIAPRFELVVKSRRQNDLLTEQEEAITQIEDRALRDEIHPHFLLNVLNNVLVAYREDVEEGKQLLQELTDLERFVFESSEKEFVPLSGELDILQRLIHLYALERKSDIVFDLEIKDEDILIPALMLEPLVENSLIHSGIFSRPDGRITIKQRSEFGLETIVISDNGVGADASRLYAGIGVSNVQRRVGLLEGGNMEITSSDEGTTVTIAFQKI